jgi:hypothetical protein
MGVVDSRRNLPATAAETASGRGLTTTICNCRLVKYARLGNRLRDSHNHRPFDGYGGDWRKEGPGFYFQPVVKKIRPSPIAA